MDIRMFSPRVFVRNKKYDIRKQENLYGYLFAGPAILGLFLWAFIPIVYSFYLSMTDWNVLTEHKFLWFDNYRRIFTEDLFFYLSLRATFYYTFGTVIAANITAFSLALLLNNDFKGKPFFRTLFYLPTIVPIVAQSILWLWLFNPDYGLFNNILSLVGISPVYWLSDENMVIPSLIIMAVWTSGGGMIIYLAGLQSVPSELMDAVGIDGGNYLHKLKHIIIPYLSPVIFFNFLMSTIGSLQVFTQAIMMTGGGPNNRSLFYSYYLYITAFQNNNMGYACALAWILFAISAVISGGVVLIIRNKIYYEGEN